MFPLCNCLLHISCWLPFGSTTNRHHTDLVVVVCFCFSFMAQHSLVCFVCVFLKVNGYFLNRNKGINKKQEARNWKRGEEKISSYTNEQMPCFVFTRTKWSKQRHKHRPNKNDRIVSNHIKTNKHMCFAYFSSTQSTLWLFPQTNKSTKKKLSGQVLPQKCGATRFARLTPSHF